MTSRDVIDDVVSDWDEQIKNESVMGRDIGSAVSGSANLEEITVIRGVRRSGKTFLLYGLKKELGGVYLNFEDERLIDIGPADLEKILDIAVSRGTNILYLDEVQNVAGWEKFAHRALRRMKIFVTGSNSSLLASGYAKALIGRTKTFEMYPLSFREFLKFKNSEPDRRSLIEYMRTGGFPRIVMTGDLSLGREYFERIIYRDVASFSGITNVEALRNIAIVLLSNIGKEFSYRSLESVSGLRHEETVKNYIAALEDAYLLKVLTKFHPSLKVQQSYGKKAYSVDPAFIGLGKRLDSDQGRILENLVYLQLRRSNADLFYGKDVHEIDFLVCQGLKPGKAVTVTLEADDPRTLKREISQLEYFGRKMDIPMELVSMYPCKVPDEIENRLAHRYLLE